MTWRPIPFYLTAGEPCPRFISHCDCVVSILKPVHAWRDDLSSASTGSVFYFKEPSSPTAESSSVYCIHTLTTTTDGRLLRTLLTTILSCPHSSDVHRPLSSAADIVIGDNGTLVSTVMLQTLVTTVLSCLQSSAADIVIGDNGTLVSTVI